MMAKLGESNYALGSHHSIHKDMLFAPLEHIEQGADIYVTDLDHIYHYTADNIFVVDPYQLSVLDPSEKPIITLLTCDSSLQNRIIVQGELKHKVAMNDATPEMLQAFQLEQTVPQ